MNVQTKLSFSIIFFLATSCYSSVYADEYRCMEVIEEDLIMTSCFLDHEDTVFQHGPYVIRKNNGLLVLVGEFRLGNQDGIWLTFDENGVLMKYIAYNDGIKVFESDSLQVMQRAQPE